MVLWKKLTGGRGCFGGVTNIVLVLGSCPIFPLISSAVSSTWHISAETSRVTTRVICNPVRHPSTPMMVLSTARMFCLQLILPLLPLTTFSVSPPASVVQTVKWDFLFHDHICVPDCRPLLESETLLLYCTLKHIRKKFPEPLEQPGFLIGFQAPACTTFIR